MITALMMTASLAGADPDGVVATAPATPEALAVAAQAPVAPSVEGAARQAAPHGLTTDQQIDRWIAARDPSATPYAEAREPEEDRRVHGEFSVTVGTGGYRDYGATVTAPLGETGFLTLNVRQTENGYRHHGGRYFDDPYLASGGYVFPGAFDPDAALEYERRVARPGGPPWRITAAGE